MRAPFCRTDDDCDAFIEELGALAARIDAAPKLQHPVALLAQHFRLNAVERHFLWNAFMAAPLPVEDKTNG